MKKKLLGLLLGAILIFVCAGCGAKSANSEQTEAAQTTTTEENSPKQPIEATATPVETESPTPEKAEKPSEEFAPGAEVPEATSEPTAEPIPEPQVVYTYTDISATMYATQTVNVRNLPNTDGEKIGSLSTNQEITVVGQCVETDWYKFELDGQTAFVSNSYLSTEKVEVQQSTGGGNVPANVPNALTVERGVIHDMGTYRFVIAPWRGRGREGNNVLTNTWGMHLNTNEDLWAWVEYSDPNDAALAAFIKANGCHCGNPDHNGLYPERLGN